MSIYSGFATRKMEQNYNQLLSKLLTLLQDHLIETLSSQKQLQISVSQNKLKKYRFLLSKMEQYEQHKYLPPKFSKICQPLKQLLGIKGEEFVQFPLNNDFRSSKTGFKNQYKKQQEKSNEKQLSHDKSANIELRTPKTIFYRPRTHKTQFDSKSQIRNRSTTNKSIARSQFYKQKTTQSMQKGKNNLMIHIEQPTMCRLNPKFSEQTTNSNKKQQMEKIYSNKNDLSKLNQSGQIRYRNKKAELMRKTFQSKKVMKNAKYQEKDNEQQYKRRGNMQVKVQFKQSYPKFNIKDELRKNIKSTQ